MPFDSRDHRILLAGIGEPDSVIKIVDDLLPEDFCNDEFKNRRPDGACFTMDEHKIRTRHRPKQQGDAANETTRDRQDFLKHSSTRIQHPPGAVCEKGAKVNGEVVLFQCPQVLLKPESLRRSNALWVWAKEKNSSVIFLHFCGNNAQ